MLTRIESFYDWFRVTDEDRQRAKVLIEQALEDTQGMMAPADFESIAALMLALKPKTIFEIGTFKGVTTNFILSLLPECRIYTMAYIRPSIKWLGKKYNNSGLSKDEIGACIEEQHKKRVTQLYGDSHKLDPRFFIETYGRMDCVFIDGDHTYEGVSLDTELAEAIIEQDGCICWHDANPREKYLGVRNYLEKDLPFKAIATQDNYIGGIAAWNHQITARLNMQMQSEEREVAV